MGRPFHLQQVLIGLYDKGRVGTVIETETRLIETESGIVYATVTGSVVAKGQGSWGGPEGNAASSVHLHSMLGC